MNRITFTTLALFLSLSIGCQPPEVTGSGSGSNATTDIVALSDIDTTDSGDETGLPLDEDQELPLQSESSGDVDSKENMESESGSDSESEANASTGELTPGPDGVIDVSFTDIELLIQEDVVFRPMMLTKKAQALDGQRIRISGFMMPDTRTRGIKQFVLLKNLECKFGPGGRADHLLNVLMTADETANYRQDTISVEGVLKVKPFTGPDGNTWSIYDLDCNKVEKYRPRR